MDNALLLKIAVIGLLVIAVLFQIFARLFLRGIGKAALAGQADQITLAPAPGQDWAAKPAVAALLTPLLSRGFSKAGSFTIPEMKNMAVHFLTNERDGVSAALYEYPAIGNKLDLFTRFTDGGSFTATATTRGAGLNPRPGHDTIRQPGADALTLLGRLLRERPQKDFERLASAALPARFAEAFAESMAWRKAQGISAKEVAKTAARR